MDASSSHYGCRVFISYRREDAEDAAHHLAEQLIERFGAERVFIDVDSIGAADDWAADIDKAINSCDAFLALIGDRWFGDGRAAGKRRIDAATDPVRLELEAALTTETQVIPVLIRNASMPRESELPESLRLLLVPNAVELSHRTWRKDVAGLIRTLEQIAQAKTEVVDVPAGFELHHRQVEAEVIPGPTGFVELEKCVFAVALPNTGGWEIIDKPNSRRPTLRARGPARDAGMAGPPSIEVSTVLLPQFALDAACDAYIDQLTSLPRVQRRHMVDGTRPIDGVVTRDQTYIPVGRAVVLQWQGRFGLTFGARMQNMAFLTAAAGRWFVLRCWGAGGLRPANVVKGGATNVSARWYWSKLSPVDKLADVVSTFRAH